MRLQIFAVLCGATVMAASMMDVHDHTLPVDVVVQGEFANVMLQKGNKRQNTLVKGLAASATSHLGGTVHVTLSALGKIPAHT
jgi:hypothetical protein